jgi:hypothetical protein
MEFRCFVWDGDLVGCCQRHVGVHFPFLAQMRGELQLRLLRFFEDVVGDVFPLPSCALRRGTGHARRHSHARADTYDVCLLQSGGVRLLDFNPWGAATLPLLFHWDELAQLAAGDEPPHLRVVETAQHIRPGLRTGVPLDLYQTGEGSALAEFISRQQREEAAQNRAHGKNDDDGNEAGSDP